MEEWRNDGDSRGELEKISSDGRAENIFDDENTLEETDDKGIKVFLSHFMSI